MRIGRLDLKKYGRFTGASIDFPKGEHDFHIVFGPNEAGKSTALSAISDMLFGIPHNSSYNFLHGYGDMRIGASLENAGETIVFYRRKGKKETLLSVDGFVHPLGEKALSPFLSEYDRSFFERMFSLDYVRLSEGGKEILESRDEAGQILFSAGTGLSGLRDQLVAIDAKMDGLWGPRRSSKRRYTQLEENLKEVERKLREHSLSGASWLELKNDVSRIQSECDLVDQQIGEKSSTLRKLERIRRVFRDVGRLNQIESECALIGSLPFLPSNARGRLEKAQEKMEGARIQAETLKGRLEASHSDRTKIFLDETILSRSSEIGRLHEIRINVQKAKSDLPKRQGELLSATSEILSLAKELSWESLDVGSLLEKIPTRARSLAVSKLLSERGRLSSSLSSAEKSLLETKLALESLQKKHFQKSPPVDLSSLELALSSFRSASHRISSLESLRKELSGYDSEILSRLSSLYPGGLSLEGLLAVNVPSSDRMAEIRDQLATWAEKEGERNLRIQAVEQEVGSLKATCDGIFRREKWVSREALGQLREKRDQVWDLIKRLHVQGLSVSESEVFEILEKNDPVTFFEELQREVDNASDRRFDKAEIEARVGVLLQKLDEQKGLLDELCAQKKRALESREILLDEWRSLWKLAPFAPQSPEMMLQWIADRDLLVELSAKRELSRQKIEAISGETGKLVSLLTRELLRVDTSQSLTGEESLDFLADMAERCLLEFRAGKTSWNLEEQQLSQFEEELKRRDWDLEGARKGFEKWESLWSDALSEIGISSSRSTEVVSHLLETIDRMRVLEEPIRLLRHRVESILRDTEVFDEEVRSLVAFVAPDLLPLPPEESMRVIEKRLDQAEKAVRLCEQKDLDILSISESIQRNSEEAREASEAIRILLDASGVQNSQSLFEIILKQERLMALDAEREALQGALLKNGDGLLIPDLVRECGEISEPGLLGDEVNARIQEIEALRAGQKILLEERSRVKRSFDSLGGDLVAVDAASDRQKILSEMREVAEQVVCLKGASILLRWSIDRYRKENQGPLLSRASRFFSHLTLGSFESLGVDYDDQDRVALIGLRADGLAVGVDGMSTGTADQLFLALRLASVGEFLEGNMAMPFIADDLFINFDDDRAKAALGVLWELSTKTQVIFLTHHRHLVNLGREVLGESVPVVSLISDRER